jgi:hypothetical protein
MPLPHRWLQVGLSGEAIDRYVDEWTVGVTDITSTAHEIRDLLRDGNEPAAVRLLPAEREYLLPAGIGSIVDASEV